MKKEYTYEVGDVVTMKKPHPCGSKEWEILRVGADFAWLISWHKGVKKLTNKEEKHEEKQETAQGGQSV